MEEYLRKDYVLLLWLNMENKFQDIDDIPLRVEIQPYMFEPPARAEPTENSEENSETRETSTSDGDDESRLLNTIWSVVLLEIKLHIVV